MSDFSWYDTQRICLNGHQIELSVDQMKMHDEVFCDECGEKGIVCCQNCGKPIRGRKRSFNNMVEVIRAKPKVPKCCYSCGRPYPWSKDVENNLDDGLAKIVIRPEIREHIERYMNNEDYFHAVEEAYKVVRDKLRKLTTEEKATEVFNNNAESRRYYKQLFGKIEPDDDAERDFFRGVGYMHLAVQFLRNERMHTIACPIDKNLAVHYVALASLAYELISRTSTKD